MAAYHFIVNPTSGRGSTARRLAEARAGLLAAGRAVVVHYTRAVGHATELAAELGADAAAIIAVGGDGTVREVAAGLQGRTAPLAILPAGTENLIAKQLGHRNRPRDLVRMLLHGQGQAVDLAFRGERPFLVIAGIGFDAEVVRRVTATRDGHITHMSYFWPIWRTFWNHRFPQVDVTVDDRSLFSGPGLVFVGNMPRYATNLNICTRANWTDGLLDVCILPTRHQVDLVRHAARVAAGLHLDRGGVIYARATRVRVTGDAGVPVECDGDDAGVLPAEFTIIPGAVAVLVPVARSVPAVAHPD